MSAMNNEVYKAYRQDAAALRLPTPRSHWPQDNAQGLRIMAMASVAPHWSPSIWKRELLKLIAAGDVGALQALLPLAQSLVEYRAPFRGTLTDVLIDAQESLDGVE